MKLYNLFENIILEETIKEKMILCEGASYTQVNDAIQNRYRVRIEYKDNENKPPTKRFIEVYAIGLSKAGNPVIRAYQLFGGTTTKIPKWKFFRLDKIVKWEPTKVKFNTPIDVRDPSVPKFNKYGDKTMSTVNKIMKFDNINKNKK